MADKAVSGAKAHKKAVSAFPFNRETWEPSKKKPDDNELWLMQYVRTQTGRNTWYYKDRCGVSRGPAPVPTMREAWVHGLIDENTLVWGQGQADFLPIKNVRYLIPQIRIPEGEPAQPRPAAEVSQAYACTNDVQLSPYCVCLSV